MPCARDTHDRRRHFRRVRRHCHRVAVGNSFAVRGLFVVGLRKEASLEQLIVVTHPDPVVLEARPIDDVETSGDSVALGYYHDGHVLARGVVANEALEAIHGLLSEPVSLALAATEDEAGNIDARVCLVLPVDPDEAGGDEDEAPDEPWRASVPAPPGEAGGDYEDRPKLALLPIGHAVRGASHRNHADVAGDVREMLTNLLTGRSRDAVARAIDDLLGSL
jgi:hypothetical protein